MFIYQVAFWTAVDLRFREFINPQIRLNIAGLVVPQVKLIYSLQKMGVIQKSSFQDENADNYMDFGPGGQTLRNMRRVFSNAKYDFPPKSYDIILGVIYG